MDFEVESCSFIVDLIVLILWWLQETFLPEMNGSRKKSGILHLTVCYISLKIT